MILDPGGFSDRREDYTVCTVSRITPSGRIVVKGNQYYPTDGACVTRAERYISRSRLLECTEEAHREIYERAWRKQIGKELLDRHNKNNLSFSQYKDIAFILGMVVLPFEH